MLSSQRLNQRLAYGFQIYTLPTSLQMNGMMGKELFARSQSMVRKLSGGKRQLELK
jgi:hypothetical protein